MQVALSCLALILAVLTILMAAGSSTNHTDSWREASSLTLAGIGLVLDAGALLVLAQYGKHQAPAGEGRETRVRKVSSLLPLTAQLLFNASVLGPYRVLAVVLSLTTTTTTTTTTATTGLKIEEAALAALVAMVAFSQLFCSMYFFRLARIWRAFDDGTNDQQQQQQEQQQHLLPRRGLKDLFHVLGLKPSPSEMAELASIVESEEEEMEAKAATTAAAQSTSSSCRGQDTGLTFEDVCRILAHYTEIHASRKRRRHQRRRALEAAAAGGGEGSGPQLLLSSPAAAAAPAAPQSLPARDAVKKGEDLTTKDVEKKEEESM